MQRTACKPFDFDDWARLAAEDPAAFEARRAAVIHQFIENTPHSRRERLRSLQWRIDRTRERASNPIAACVRISRMMWDSLLGDCGLLPALDALRSGRSWPRKTATILPFRRRDDREASRTRR